MEKVIPYLPNAISDQLEHVPHDILRNMEELRIRINRPIEIIANREVQYLPYVVQTTDAEHFINKISQHSLYALEEELKKGYITIEGGHRVGLAGRVILNEGSVKAIRDISSFNIRIAREKIGVANRWVPYVYRGRWKNTMIIGPPQTGKTTLLRDFARIISTGNPDENILSKKVGIIDERSEIAGCVGGVPQLTFGVRVDVMDGCPKAEGMMMMIRSMSPDVLIVDEIGRKEDTEAILEAVHAGIRLFMTTHGESYEDLLKRPTLQPILEQKIFERYIELRRDSGPGMIAAIKDENGNEIIQKRVLNRC